MHRLLERAREQLGAAAPLERVLAQASYGLVFIDEVDKIRSRVGDQVQVSGIRAQEALLTLIENETVPLRLPEWGGRSHGGRWTPHGSSSSARAPSRDSTRASSPASSRARASSP